MPQRPFVSGLITLGISCVAAYSSWALVAHNWITWDPSHGPSMYPSIPSSLSYNIYSRRYKRGKNIKIGDVVVFESPIFLRGMACKRVIGMPGDYVLRDPHMSPTVGGAPIPGLYEGDGLREEPVMVQVPEGHVWVAGDNLSYSRDSRFYGPVPMALITGKTLYVGDGYFNWTSFRKSQLQPATVSDVISQTPVEGKVALEDTQPG
ncbi:uncharacterized protein A1O5_11512 [Cladophialophora psammophila CBS 110553]|uniref:Mitochondrial inner membrane protease subunit n=1 Tax=Cladophialophora psammophila CBS 110553 TaxID=1182543 RepID=W9W681_9EURO|nr:uncharacterized protein A1O5_11512 [Cladophialophora psammophila CBS 110553]EXJ63463.1 hypothetical protein A1O5_11512 [Cladophialophora psammophila CBS 110553]